MTGAMTSQQSRQVLIVLPNGGEDDPVLPVLRQQFDLTVVTTAEEALRLLRAHDFDLVIASTDQLRALNEAGNAALQIILSAIEQSACIVDRAGQVIWRNDRMEQYPPQVPRAIGQACAAAAETLEGAATTVRETVVVEGGAPLDVRIAPLPDAQGAIEQFVALVCDKSDNHRLRDKLNAIDRAGRELVGINTENLASMDIPDRLALLEERIIRCCRELLHFDHFAVLLIDEKTRRLETLIASGITQADTLDLFAEREGSGVTGYVAATGESYCCVDVTQDQRYVPGLEDARSCLAVPLSLHDRVIGVLNVESDKVAAFSDEDRQFAEIFGRYIALALHILQLLAVERHATTGQIAADVEAECATPLNDIAAGVAGLMDTCAADPALRARLAELLGKVDQVKEAIHAATRRPAVVIGTGSPADANTLAGKHILIADDEDIIRETIAEVLAGAGAIVTTAKDGNEAVRLIRASSFDLVLSDIKMPNRNGYEVFAAAREAREDCAVILITGFGYDPEHSVVRASREGLAGVLFKPFKVEQLLEQIRNAICKTAS